MQLDPLQRLGNKRQGNAYKIIDEGGIMPKVTLVFKLPEEKSEYDEAVFGGRWKFIVYELSMLLRNKLKHGHDHKTADEALEAVREALWAECKDQNLDPWED